MHVARDEPLIQARAPTNKTPVIDSRTRITTVISSSVIPGERATNLLFDRVGKIPRLAGEGGMCLAYARVGIAFQ